MAFIHKNINSALLMLITFISVALVTATVYSVEAFDSMNEAYAEKAMQVDALAAELAAKEAMTDSLQKTAQLTQERENALAEILEKQRQETAPQSTDSAAQVSTEPATKDSVTYPSAAYNQYRKPSRTWGWPYSGQKRYVY
jgi:biopolymer transport protein ExbB/TolQ